VAEAGDVTPAGLAVLVKDHLHQIPLRDPPASDNPEDAEHPLKKNAVMIPTFSPSAQPIAPPTFTPTNIRSFMAS
jgi:hypothetical protein